MYKVVFKNLPSDLDVNEFFNYLNQSFTTTDVFPLTKDSKFTGICFVTFKENHFTTTKYFNKSFYKNMRIICEIYVPKEEEAMTANDKLIEENYFKYNNQEKVLKKEEYVNILYLNLPSIFKKTDSAVKFFFKEQEMINKIKEFFFNNNIHLHKLTSKKSKTKLLVRGMKEIKTHCKIIPGPDSLVNIYEFDEISIKKGIKELQKSVWEYLPLCQCQVKGDLKHCMEKEDLKKKRKEKYEKIKNEKTEKKGKSEKKEEVKLLIKNLPFQASIQEVKKLFLGYKIKNIRIPIKRSGESRGFGFVECEKKVGEEVIKKFSDCHFYGRRLHILYAEN